MKSLVKTWGIVAAIFLLLPFALAVIADAPAKKASTDTQAKILKLQLQATRIQSQFQSCQQTDFQGQFNQVTAGMVALSEQALAEAKLDKKEWELNLDTFEFQKRTAPAPVADKK